MEEEGFLRLIGKLYDSSSKQYTKEDIMPDMNIWYKGGLVIEEIKTIETSSDSSGRITKATPTAYYLFMDRKTKSFYHYSSFSDTARILDKYTLEDSSEMRGSGGWGFYKNHTFDSVGQRQYLTDTLMNGVLYKRVHFFVKEGKDTLSTIRYIRCDKKETLFSFNTSLRKELGCPIVRIDYLLTTENPIPGMSEIVFVRDSLTSDELKVFGAWGKNIIKNR